MPKAPPPPERGAPKRPPRSGSGTRRRGETQVLRGGRGAHARVGLHFEQLQLLLVEKRGQTQKVARTDPDTDISRQFEEWVEIKKDCSSPHMMDKAQP